MGAVLSQPKLGMMGFDLQRRWLICRFSVEDNGHIGIDKDCGAVGFF